MQLAKLGSRWDHFSESATYLACRRLVVGKVWLVKSHAHFAMPRALGIDCWRQFVSLSMETPATYFFALLAAAVRSAAAAAVVAVVVVVVSVCLCDCPPPACASAIVAVAVALSIFMVPWLPLLLKWRPCARCSGGQSNRLQRVDFMQ